MFTYCWQCCGSVTCWYGSGSSSGFGSESCYFCQWPSRWQLKIILFPLSFFLLNTFWSYIYIIFQSHKELNKSQNSWNQGFSYYFCVMIEGFGAGSVPRINRSGSKRPKTSGSATLILLISSREALYILVLYCWLHTARVLNKGVCKNTGKPCNLCC
jgi:hypothetical protein